jgi:uncharacterized protein YndB with AHSA1/START domain
MSAVHREVFVRCSPAHAFTVFTQQVDLWWPPAHRRQAGGAMLLEARTGGRFGELAPDGALLAWGEVRACEPGARLLLSFLPGGGPQPTEVEVRFSTVGEATLVQIEHRVADSGLGALWPDRARLFDRNWSALLAAFQGACDPAGAPLSP